MRLCGRLLGRLLSRESSLRPLGTFFSFTEITDEDNSIAAMYQAVGELPQANRDTLAFLMIHLQR